MAEHAVYPAGPPRREPWARTRPWPRLNALPTPLQAATLSSRAERGLFTHGRGAHLHSGERAWAIADAHGRRPVEKHAAAWLSAASAGRPLRRRGAYPLLSAASAEHGARRRGPHALSPSRGHPRVPAGAPVGIGCTP